MYELTMSERSDVMEALSRYHRETLTELDDMNQELRAGARGYSLEQIHDYNEIIRGCEGRAVRLAELVERLQEADVLFRDTQESPWTA